MKKRLIALYPILYQAKQYSVGDELPTNNNDMTEKWIKGGSAKWDEQSESENRPLIEVIKEEYENKIAKIEEDHKAEIEKINTEKEELQKKYDELLKSQALGNLEENQNVNSDETLNEDNNADTNATETQKLSKAKAKNNTKK